jgi:DNA-binding transcriptional regulator YdaS (Cro superfamily)
VNRTPIKLIGVLLVAGLAVAACGSDDKTGNASTDTTPTTATADHAMAQGTESGASQLRSGLTSLLQEHVYLAGITTGTALAGQDYKPAAAALDANTQGLQDAIASVYGDAGGKQFGDLWRKHIGFFVDYTTGKATNDQAKMAKAKADLDGYRADFGAFIESATKGGLPKQAVADELKPHVETLLAAIDAQAAKSPDAVEKLKMAADHMPMTALILSGAIVKQFPDKFDGTVDSPAATLRATLTAALQEHVYLAGITTGTALAGQDYKPAAAVLDENTQSLQDAIASVYGDAGGKQFGDLWRKHIGFFVDYTTGKATKDQAMVDKARADLDGYRADFGAFIESATKGGLPKQAVADELKPHVESLFAAIDAQAAKDPGQFDKLKAAAGHMPMTASILAGAIAKQFPDKFAG